MDQVRYAIPIPTVAAIAEVLARSPRSQPWRHEAPCRALIRSLLCLQGDKWWHADRVAFVTVAKARIEVGTRAPVGGDSDFDLSSWLEYSHCVICDRPFVPYRLSQECCSYACHKRQRYLETRLVELARCEHCRDPMDVAQPSQKYCSTRCRKASSYLRTRQEWGRIRECRTCGGPISDSVRGDSLYCSEVCRNKWHRELPGKVEVRREQYREAAGVVVHASCIQCGKPLPEGSNARRKFCSDACNQANYRARKLNGHDHPMDPPPTIDPTTPEIENACLRIALELEAVKREHPEMTPRQALQEARRRSATTMVAAADAIAAERALRRLSRRITDIAV